MRDVVLVFEIVIRPRAVLVRAKHESNIDTIDSEHEARNKVGIVLSDPCQKPLKVLRLYSEGVKSEDPGRGLIVANPANSSLGLSTRGACRLCTMSASGSSSRHQLRYCNAMLSNEMQKCICVCATLILQHKLIRRDLESPHLNLDTLALTALSMHHLCRQIILLIFQCIGLDYLLNLDIAPG